MKKIAVLALVGIMSIMSVFTTAAAPLSGWEISTGAPRYYLNGEPVKNNWIKYGNQYYYLNADGYTVPNFVVNQDALMASTIDTYVDVLNGGAIVKLDKPAYNPYAAVKNYFNVANDFDAFKKLHPEVVMNFGTNASGLYDYYLSTYHGTTPTTVYLDALKRCVTDNSNPHNYTYSFQYMGNETHRAYCSCGAWIEGACDHKKTASDGDEKCSVCGHHFS